MSDPTTDDSRWTVSGRPCPDCPGTGSMMCCRPENRPSWNDVLPDDPGVTIRAYTWIREPTGSGPHTVVAANGERDACGGPGVCPLCDGKITVHIPSAATCLCDPDVSYGYDPRCRVHGHSAPTPVEPDPVAPPRDPIDDLVDWQLAQRPATVWWTCPTCRTGWQADEEIVCCGIRPVRGTPGDRAGEAPPPGDSSVCFCGVTWARCAHCFGTRGAPPTPGTPTPGDSVRRGPPTPGSRPDEEDPSEGEPAP